MVNRVRFLVSAIVVSQMIAGSVLSRAAGPVEKPESNDVLKSVSSHLPSRWTVQGHGSAYTVKSPDEMPLHPSPATGLPHGDIRARCSFIIRVGEKLSVDERARRWAEDQKKKHYKGEPYVWLPDFYDDQNGYEIQGPGYCPNTKEDQEIVTKCYEAVTRQWTVYPTSRRADPKYFSDCLKFGQ